MALHFRKFGVASARVNLTTSATLAPAKGTLVWWMQADKVRPSGGYGNLFSKSDPAGVGGFRFLSLAPASGVQALGYGVKRATTNLFVEAKLPDFGLGLLPLGAWVCCGVVWDEAGANGDQRLYLGTFDMPMRAPAAYSTQNVGSGAVTSTASYTAKIGVNGPNNAAFYGALGPMAVFSRHLTPGEMWSWARRPRRLPECNGLWTLRRGAGTQVDMSGNGNHGTVTATTEVATVSDPPFLFSPRIRRIPYGQRAYPDADDAVGGGVRDDAGSPLYAAIDETRPGQTDYVQLAAGVAAYRAGLANLSTPQSGRVRVELDAAWEP